MSFLTIEFLGIGMMGVPMGHVLLQAGLQVHVWNRSAAKAEALAMDGAVARLVFSSARKRPWR